MTFPTVLSKRQLPPTGTGGVADARLLPDTSFGSSWDDIVLPADMKAKALRSVVAGIQLRARVDRTLLPLHGIVLLTGLPGVGKTTLARGLANRIAQAMAGPQWAFIEIDPHALTSSSLGRSQRSVEQLFSEILSEHASVGPLVVLIDEVETLIGSRQDLSMDANPIDVHRAIDAALVGLDRLAAGHKDLVILATTNFPAAVDDAFKSRADVVIEVPLPDLSARTEILRSSVNAIAKTFNNAAFVNERGIARAAEASDGMDARRLRKAVAEACGMSPAAAGDPAKVTIDDLLAAIGQARR